MKESESKDDSSSMHSNLLSEIWYKSNDYMTRQAASNKQQDVCWLQFMHRVHLKPTLYAPPLCILPGSVTHSPLVTQTYLKVSVGTCYKCTHFLSHLCSQYFMPIYIWDSLAVAFHSYSDRAEVYIQSL